MKRVLLLLVGVVPLMLAVENAIPLQAQSAPPPDFFQTKVEPVITANCIGCHGNAAMGGLRMDSREAVLKGGKTGPAIVVGDPEGSLLIAAVRQTGALKMPQGGPKLSDAQIADIATWIKDGAVWPQTVSTAGGKPETVLTEFFELHI